MPIKSVLCIATTRHQAEQIVERLEFENYSNHDISALFADQTTHNDFAHDKAPDGVATSAGTVGAIGGALGWIPGIGMLTVPGAGQFIAGGPVIAALSSTAVGGIAGRLIGLGIPELEAMRYDGKLKASNILISVHSEKSGEIHRAEEIFTEAGAQDICTTGESSTPKESRATRHLAHPTEAAYSYMRP